MKVHLTKYGTIGPPLVLFHGWGFDSHIWLHLIDPLKSIFQLILVDLPGFGKTPIMSWEDFKFSLLDQIPCPFALAGWSLGGLYATKLAFDLPQQVSHLLNIASSPRFLFEPAWPGVKREVFNGFYRNIANNPYGTLMEFIKLQAGKVEMQTISVPELSALEHGLQILETWDLRQELSQLEMPTCFMFGRLDPITPMQIMQTMINQYPDFQYVLFKKSAHMPFLSQQTEFIKELREFVL